MNKSTAYRMAATAAKTFFSAVIPLLIIALESGQDITAKVVWLPAAIAGVKALWKWYELTGISKDGEAVNEDQTV